MAKSGKYVNVKSTIAGCIADGASEIVGLAEEMSSWRDSLEEKFSGTSKYETVSETADTLEGSDIESLAERVTDALSLASEGKDAIVGCPTHVSGTPCPVCKWNGVPKPGSDPAHLQHLVPKILTGSGERSPFGDKKEYVGRIGSGIYTDKEEYDRDAAQSLAKYERCIAPQIPSERKAEAAADPLFDFCLEDKEIEVSSYVPYKGKSASRAQRCGDACGLIRAGCEAIEEALSEVEDEMPDPPLSTEEIEEKAARIEEIRDAVEELVGALDEIEGVDFPGMYG